MIQVIQSNKFSNVQKAVIAAHSWPSSSQGLIFCHSLITLAHVSAWIVVGNPKRKPQIQKKSGIFQCSSTELIVLISFSLLERKKKTLLTWCILGIYFRSLLLLFLGFHLWFSIVLAGLCTLPWATVVSRKGRIVINKYCKDSYWSKDIIFQGLQAHFE